MGLESGTHPLFELRSRLECAGRRIFDLTLSNPTAAGFDYPEASIRQALSRERILRYQPDPKGLMEARKAVSQYYLRRGLEVDPDRLLLTSSTSEAYSFLLKMLCAPGDEVFIPRPSYPLLDDLATLEHVRLIPYELTPDFSGALSTLGQTLAREGDSLPWRLDLKRLRRCISTRSKAIVLIHPNNPTGNLLNAAELEGLVQLAEEYGLALIVDEVFSDYLFTGRFQNLVSEGPLVFTLNGLSKTSGLPQLKLGWIRVDGAEPSVRLAMECLELLADTYLSVNIPVQVACSELLDLAPSIQSQVKARLLGNLAMARETLADHQSLIAWPPEAGWHLILQAPARGSDDQSLAIELLEATDTLVHPGSMYGLDKSFSRLRHALEPKMHWVISLLPRPEDFSEGMRRLSRHFT